MDNNLSPQESLQLIKGMINKAQNKFADNSFLYLLWGWVILICALYQYCILKFDITILGNSSLIWLATIPTGIFQIFYLMKADKESKTVTYTDELIKYSWIVYGITMALISFIAARLNLWDKVYPIIFVIYGIPTFLSGVIMKFTPLKIGAICCWIIAIAATYVTLEDYLLLLSLAMITTWIIPGYLLKKKYAKA